MKRVLLLTFLLSQTIFCAFAQNSTGSTPVVYDAVYRLELPPGQNKIINQNAPANLDGSPFLNESWEDGSIFMNNGDTIPTIKLRLNVYKNEMQFLHKEKTYAIGAPEGVKFIKVGRSSFVFLSYEEKGTPKKGYFEEIYDGKVSLLINYYPEILPANFNVQLNSGNKNDQITIKKKYYAKIGDKIVEIDKRGKKFISSFGEKEPLISKYIKDNKISFKNEGDLVSLIIYSNTLI